MTIYRFEGSVFVRSTDLRAKDRMISSDDTYSYRYVEINPLLKHIKRKYA